MGWFRRRPVRDEAAEVRRDILVELATLNAKLAGFGTQVDIALELGGKFFQVYEKSARARGAHEADLRKLGVALLATMSKTHEFDYEGAMEKAAKGATDVLKTLIELGRGDQADEVEIHGARHDQVDGPSSPPKTGIVAGRKPRENGDSDGAHR